MTEDCPELLEARMRQHNAKLVHIEPRYIPDYADLGVQAVTRGGACTGSYNDG